jgi:transposase-like protein/ribosomal protein L37AE/L43A
MEDYPRTLGEFEQRFAAEAACRAYLEKLRWPEGFVCPRCKNRGGWRSKRGLWSCAACDFQASVTAGTIFQDTHKPLTMWFRVMWWVCCQKHGASALNLQMVLGLRSYQTAWAWMHKLRRAMVRPGRDMLDGRVEVDETYLGSLEEGHPGRSQNRKALVVVAAQEDGPGVGRVRMRRILNAKTASLHPFIQSAVAPGAVVVTDGWAAYGGLETLGFVHEVTPERLRRETGQAVLPRVHQVVSLLKRWLMGTHQGAVSHEHLDYYLDEFTFRFNRRTSQSRGKLFYRLAQQAVLVAPAPYKSLIKHIHTGPQRRTDPSLESSR